jgi:hypothetical protein
VLPQPANASANNTSAVARKSRFVIGGEVIGASIGCQPGFLERRL